MTPPHRPRIAAVAGAAPSRARESRVREPRDRASHPSPGRIRPLVEADIAPLTRLHRRTFGTDTPLTDRQLHDYLLQLFCRHPWFDERLPSLIYEESEGRIAGCLGVMPRPMVFAGRPILAVVSHNFMVDPDHRSPRAAMELLKALFAGPQDLSLAEGNDSSRRLWKAMGAATSMAYSLRWTCPLEPARFALAVLSRRGLAGWAAKGLRPLSALADLAAARLPGGPLRRPLPELEAEEPDNAALADEIGRHAQRFPLAPSYESAALGWLLATLDARPDRGPLRRVLLRKQGRVVGWYLYYLRPGDVSEVVQAAAAGPAAGEVLDHLFHDARRHGATAVTGLLDPSLLPALSERPCLFHRGRTATWLLLHAREERYLRPLLTGDAFFTRLEGEWWL